MRQHHGMAIALVAALLLGGCQGPKQSTNADSHPFPLAPRTTTTELDESPAQRDQRMQWWREAKFGMFIHWGVYAVPAGTYQDKQIRGIGEWIMLRAKIPCAEYQAYAKQFTAAQYDPDAWAALAAEAGMRYIVITSKHHDGFALYPTKVSPWNVVDATPYGKDLIGPLAEAARQRGLRFGLYYSQAQDWNHPGGAAHGKPWDPLQTRKTMDQYIEEIAVPQVREILTWYQPDILWWDTPKNMTQERADKLRPLIALAPGIITNNRLGGGYKGDTETPEQRIPATGIEGRDWETCMTMNRTWGYKSYDDNWKSTEDLIRKLCDIVSKGGNFLLNVGPTAEGVIPEPSVVRLREIGQWMKTNGEAIYQTTASPFAKLPFGRCTKRVTAEGTTLYLHVFDWPEDGKLLLPGLQKSLYHATVLATGKTLTTSQTAAGLVVHVPAEAPDAPVAVIRVDVRELSRMAP
jgi:alpha-L-fucosidase